jgi:hypothetical protein
LTLPEAAEFVFAHLWSWTELTQKFAECMPKIAQSGVGAPLQMIRVRLEQLRFEIHTRGFQEANERHFWANVASIISETARTWASEIDRAAIALGNPPKDCAKPVGACVVPATPTAEYCLIPPASIRWNRIKDVAPRVFALAEFILKLPTIKSHVRIYEVKSVLGNDEMSDKTVQNLLSELGKAFTLIEFPWNLSTKCGYLVIDRPS